MIFAVLAENFTRKISCPLNERTFVFSTIQHIILFDLLYYLDTNNNYQHYLNIFCQFFGIIHNKQTSYNYYETNILVLCSHPMSLNFRM